MNKLQNIITQLVDNDKRSIDVLNLDTGAFIKKHLTNNIAISEYGGLNNFFKNQIEKGVNSVLIYLKKSNGKANGRVQNWEKLGNPLNIILGDKKETPTAVVHSPVPSYPNPAQNSLGGGGLMAALGMSGQDLIHSAGIKEAYSRLNSEFQLLRQDKRETEIDLKEAKNEVLELTKQLHLKDIAIQNLEGNKKSLMEELAPHFIEKLPEMISAQKAQGLSGSAISEDPKVIITNYAKTFSEEKQHFIAILMNNQISDVQAKVLLEVLNKFQELEFMTALDQLLTQEKVSNDTSTN